jgi:DNA invertase Pin-like site-specific DNA recombinase
MKHEERAARRKSIAEHAGEHGVNAAAVAFGVHPSTVRNCATEHRISLDLNGIGLKKTTAQVQTFIILKRLLDGADPSELVKEFSVSRQRISEIKTRAKEAGFIFE